MKHQEYPIALKQAAVARVAARESIAEVARDLKRPAPSPAQSAPGSPVLIFLSHLGCSSTRWLFFHCICQRYSQHLVVGKCPSPQPSPCGAGRASNARVGQIRNSKIRGKWSERPARRSSCELYYIIISRECVDRRHCLIASRVMAECGCC
jgi:hypothetical protein